MSFQMYAIAEKTFQEQVHIIDMRLREYLESTHLLKGLYSYAFPQAKNL